MGKVIRLTESELIRIIKKVIEEQKYSPNIRPAVDNTRTNITARNYNAELQLRKNIKELSDCSKLWTSLLPKAVDYWKKWLSSKVTQQKIAKNNFEGDMEITSQVVNEYLNILTNLKIVTYYKPSQNFYAYVLPSNQESIFVNCAKKRDDKSNLVTLIHEIQHILYYHRPINPEKTISNIFETNSWKKLISSVYKATTAYELGNSTKSSNTDLGPTIKEIATKLNINANDPTYPYLKSFIESLEKSGNNKYTCDDNENMSRIMGIRQLLGIDDPTQKITVDMLKPYFTKQKENTNVWWFLSCWAENGFQDLQELLNRTNDLAMRKNKNQNQALV